MSRKRSPRFVVPIALRWLWLQLTWLVFAIDPYCRTREQPCGYPISNGTTGICGKKAPFSFYCIDHQAPIWKRLAGWWRFRGLGRWKRSAWL